MSGKVPNSRHLLPTPTWSGSDRQPALEVCSNVSALGATMGSDTIRQLPRPAEHADKDFLIEERGGEAEDGFAFPWSFGIHAVTGKEAPRLKDKQPAPIWARELPCVVAPRIRACNLRQVQAASPYERRRGDRFTFQLPGMLCEPVQ